MSLDIVIKSLNLWSNLSSHTLLLHHDFAQWKMFLSSKYDLIAALPESEQHQQQWLSLERLVGAVLTATKQQMRCDSCKWTQQQLMGLKCSRKSSASR